MDRTVAFAICCTSILLAAASIAPVNAADKLRTGLLDCDVSAGIGLIFTEKQTMTCTFKPLLGGGPVDHYTGKIEEVGISLGATEGGILVWSVISDQKGVPNGALAGRYEGLSADASLGLGLGENVLLGGSNKAFMLQPTSYEGQVGLNLAAGVTTVTLQWAP
jgi:Protein of unknown function (DUF992)